MIKFRRIRWMVHVACLAESKVLGKMCFVNLKIGDPWRSVHTEEDNIKIILRIYIVRI
jgi:hypothetical protein